jgi:hypothetical protein
MGQVWKRTDWNDIIDKINALISQCNDDVAPLDYVPENHKWSVTDIIVARDTISAHCSNAEFNTELKKWKQEIIDELNTAMGDCDCGEGKPCKPSGDIIICEGTNNGILINTPLIQCWEQNPVFCLTPTCPPSTHCGTDQCLNCTPPFILKTGYKITESGCVGRVWELWKWDSRIEKDQVIDLGAIDCGGGMVINKTLTLDTSAVKQVIQKNGGFACIRDSGWPFFCCLEWELQCQDDPGPISDQYNWRYYVKILGAGRKVKKCP